MITTESLYMVSNMIKLTTLEEVKSYINQNKIACKQLIDEYNQRNNDMARRAVISFISRYNAFEEILARIEGREETIIALG